MTSQKNVCVPWEATVRRNNSYIQWQYCILELEQAGEHPVNYFELVLLLRVFKVSCISGRCQFKIAVN